MKKILTIILPVFICLHTLSQKPDTWKITANKIDPRDYFGVTVANG
jgi:hypothetical protein